MNGIQIIAGTSHPELAKKIAKKLNIPLTPIIIKKFPNSEIYVRVEKKVRGDDIFVIQTMGDNVNDSLMELLIIIDALKRSSVRRINLICPNIAYSRQDRRTRSHEPISAKLVANLITEAGADRLVTVDLHADQIQGFYDIPVDHLVGYPLIAKYIKNKKYTNLVIVAPDIGAAKKTHKVADLLGCPIAIVDKVRTGHGVSEVAHVVGDVKGKIALIIDDMVDGGGSICGAIEVTKKYGAKKIIVAATHAFLNGEAVNRLKESVADQIIFLDTVPIPKEKKFKGMTVISLAPLLAKIIKRIHSERSLGDLFKWERQSKLL
ncbi:MAG: ribose-phosphate pyrophosphokinase [Candidatus Shapirobacteria bacterium]|nr:ribose-phosphate pyrophosphokinase [Candidatus Shapirobacteria bacterium]